MRTLLLSLSYPLLVLGTLAGCGSSSSGDGTVSLAMTVAGSRFATQAPAPGRNVQTTSRSFTPTSLKLPIMKISIAKLDGTEQKTVYQCAQSTEALCLVDLANQTELDAIAAAARSVSIPAGTYDKVMLDTCVAGSGGSTPTIAKVTGSGTGPNGSTWTTDATAVVDTTGTGVAAETEVGNWSCSTKSVIVRSGITVGTTPLTLTVVVDNYMGAVFGNLVSGGMGGCKVSGGGSSGNGLCLTYPALMAYVGTDTVTTKRFSIAHDSAADPVSATSANALIIVAVTSSGTPLMAYGRTLFTLTSEEVASNTKASSLLNGGYTLATGGPTYVTETSVASFTVASNTSVSFYQGGSADTFAAKFTAFNPATTHTGIVTSQDSVDSWHYLATLLP